MRALPPLLLALLLPAVALAQALEVKASPGSVVLGRDTEVSVSVSRPGGAPPRLQAAASSGTLSAASPEGDSGVRFTYAPPDVRYPHWATLLFWELGSGAPRPTVLRLPLLGRTTLDIATEPNAEVVVQVRGARFGPVRANARGQARVAVEVPPGVRTARVLATALGEQSEREVQLDVPPDTGFAALLGPSPVPAGDAAWLVVAGEDALTPAALELQVEGGEAQAVAGSGPPLFRITPREGSSTLSVAVGRRGETDRRALEVEVLSRPLPAAAAPAPPEAPSPWSVHALGGGFLAGGASGGPSLALGVGYALAPFGRRLTAEAEVGARSASLSAPVSGGEGHSQLLGMPLLLSLRLRLLERNALSLGARIGGGLTLFRHRLEVDGQPDYSVGGAGAAAFASLQGGYRLGALTLLLEARGSVQPVSTPSLRGQLGGFGALLGVRYVP